MLEQGDERKMTIAEIIEENAELKRMLKIAVEDIDTAMNADRCELCGNEICDKSIPCTWRHLDEVMKVIGEEK